MSNSYKIHSVTFLFFIDFCKLMFTLCYFILFPIECYLFQKNFICAFLSYMLSNLQVSDCDIYL